MKLFYTLCLALCAHIFLLAQHQDHLHPCGTVAGKSAWLQAYQRNPELFKVDNHLRNQSTTYLPISLHLVGKSDSTGAIALKTVLTSFCQLNEDYAATGIQFYIQYPIHYHYKTEWYIHNTVYEGGAMMLEKNIPNTINVYFVSSPAGNCGYNLPYAGIAMSTSCVYGHTFAHEMGHALSLPHTFLGWEGGQTHTGDVAPDFNNPAPTIVTYDYTDFKETRWSHDTLIIDSAYVENVARTGTDKNCHYAADGFCDTPADYLAYRWVCSATNAISSETQIDPTGVTFQSNGWNIMSYAHDACQVGFSAEQIDAMHAFIQQNRQSYIPTQAPNAGTIANTITLLSPATGDTIAAEMPTFTWSAVANATHYLVEIYREPAEANLMIASVLVTDTFYQVPRTMVPLNGIFGYAWRVRPLNTVYTCANFSEVAKFRTQYTVSTQQVNAQNFNMKIQPNPTTAGTGFQFIAESAKMQAGKLAIYNTLGQLLFLQKLDLQLGENNYYIQGDIFQNQKGLFLVQWQGDDATQKTISLIVE